MNKAKIVLYGKKWNLHGEGFLNIDELPDLITRNGRLYKFYDSRYIGRVDPVLVAGYEEICQPYIVTEF